VSRLRVEPLDLRSHSASAHALQVAALRTVAQATGVRGPDAGEPPYEAHSRRAGFRCVGAWDGDRLAGYAYGMTTQPGSWWDTWVRPKLNEAGCAPALDGAFELCAVFVDPPYHRRGAGGALVSSVVSGLDHPRAVLTTQGGANPARAFYRRLGFSELPVQLDHDGVPFVVLSSDLPLSAEP
jgi:GNAT superfamily N-acetyltransferase